MEKDPAYGVDEANVYRANVGVEKDRANVGSR